MRMITEIFVFTYMILLIYYRKEVIQMSKDIINSILYIDIVKSVDTNSKETCSEPFCENGSHISYNISKKLYIGNFAVYTYGEYSNPECIECMKKNGREEHISDYQIIDKEEYSEQLWSYSNNTDSIKTVTVSQDGDVVYTSDGENVEVNKI